MRAIVFGASGMVGQGVVRACIGSGDVEAVLVVGRSPAGISDPKVTELLHADLYDYGGVERELTAYDTCFFCLGVSSAGMTEAEYDKVTYELTLAAARALLRLDPSMTFCYVSGASTDGSERGRTMWARVKGKTENALLALGFPRAYMFRPGYIQPLDGIKSKTKSYRVLYAIMAPLYPLWKALFPRWVTTTRSVGQAMIRVALRGHDKPILETSDINAIAEARSAW